MMGRLRRGAAGVADFVIGEDWRTALGVAAGLGATAAVSRAGVASWWLLPVVVSGLLAWSVLRRR